MPPGSLLAQTRHDLFAFSAHQIVAYRDHPPQDHSYVTKILPFTSSIPSVKEFLGTLYASGGGDGPEAVTAGMLAALEGAWRPDAAKMIVLVADAPPHGIVSPISLTNACLLAHRLS